MSLNKAVFRPIELAEMVEKVVLDPPTMFPELSHLVQQDNEMEEIAAPLDLYTGPTAEDLRREAAEFMIKWEAEKEAMLEAARAEAEAILNEAKDKAQEILTRGGEESEASKAEAQSQGEQIIAEAQEKAKEIEAECRAAMELAHKEKEEEGLALGKEQGFIEGHAEVERLVARTRTVLERAQAKRGDILLETEQEIVNLVLLISRKVVKIISENQREVIKANVVQALRKVKGKGNITIRVNTADLQLSTEHTKNFIALVEGSPDIQIQEDSSVDAGGCIIETDFGEIDARIASQLAELEAKILEISPIRSRAKPAPSNGLGGLTGQNGNNGK
ncbi:MAG: flagellar assembly protein FliH [Treponema sp.]|nr:flagellar assembly protein FliH [Treponema sp.]